LRPRPKDLEIINEKIPKATIISMVAFLVICMVLGLFPQLATDNLAQLAQGLV
jgi:energy-converting hydrogenase B subunit F